MKLFQCQNCGNPLHFANTACVGCGDRVGYLQDQFQMSALEGGPEQWTPLADPQRPYRFCANSADDVCNWLIPADSASTLCESCRHNRTIPDLSFPENLPRWRKIELAKRYVFRSLMRWGLPAPDRIEEPETGLVFDFVSDVIRADGTIEQVKTGHAEGEITLNIAEADDAEREIRRKAMGEVYRTLLGHFRHEIGHYYWDRLVRDGGQLESFREVFGDESGDYGQALVRHYNNGPPANWQDSFISAYATAHPWEDFAETWAHYLHMVDALETARSYGINVRPNIATEVLQAKVDFEPYDAQSLQQLVQAWVPLTVAINGVNRSMGQPDLYPFILSEPVLTKLAYVHELIHARR